MKEEAYQISQYGNYPDLTKIRKILVIKMRHLGDVLLSSPVFSLLKSSLPNAQIDALIYEDTFAMLEGLPFINHYFLQKRDQGSFIQKIGADLSLYRNIRSEKYDLVINLTEGDRGAFVALISKAPIKVGFKPYKKGFWGKEKIFTHLVKRPLLPRHTVEENLDALRKIGIFPKEKDKNLYFHIPFTAKEKVSSLLKENNLQNTPYIVVHPVSRWKFKCWNESLTATLIDELSDLGFKVFITASNDTSEKLMVEKIQLLCKRPCYNLAGKLSLKDLGALIDGSKALITVDSVPLHISSALKKPTVVLFGPSSEKFWGPWQNPQAYVVAKKLSCRPCYLDGCGGSKKSDCLEQITVKDVLEALIEIKIIDKL